MALASPGTAVWTWGGVSFSISTALGCRFTITGSQTITGTGVLPITVTNWAVTPAGSALAVGTATGCLGLISSGNAVALTTAYTLSPAQTLS